MAEQLHKSSPKILKIEWGAMSIEGFGDGKDFKLFPGGEFLTFQQNSFNDYLPISFFKRFIGAEEWDWNKTNTKHDPGIQPKDVQDLLDHGAEVIVLSQGMDRVLKTAQETLDFLKGRNMKPGTDYFIEETREAVKRYNSLASENKKVGSLIHSTC